MRSFNDTMADLIMSTYGACVGAALGAALGAMTADMARMMELQMGVSSTVAGEGPTGCVLFQIELDRDSSGALCTGGSVKFNANYGALSKL